MGAIAITFGTIPKEKVEECCQKRWKQEAARPKNKHKAD
jgi:hypothetical protein